MSGHCIVVTGASSGMGKALVAKLRSQGEPVFAVDIAGDVDCACDLTASDAVQKVGAAVKAKYDGVKGFVHCAGFVRTAPLGYILSSDAKDLFALHADFPMQFLGWIAKKANHAEGTSAVLISSMACHEGDRGNVAYAAAKGAVEGMIKCAASELAPKGVRLNALALGVVDTPLAHKAWMDRSTPEQLAEKRRGYPLGFGTPEAVADIVDFFLHDQSRWITGQVLICDGGHSLV